MLVIIKVHSVTQRHQRLLKHYDIMQNRFKVLSAKQAIKKHLFFLQKNDDIWRWTKVLHERWCLMRGKNKKSNWCREKMYVWWMRTSILQIIYVGVNWEEPYSLYTVYAVYTVYTVYTVYAVYTIYYILYTVYTICCRLYTICARHGDVDGGYVGPLAVHPALANSVV